MHYDLSYRLLQSFLSNSLKGKNKELEGVPITAEPVLWCSLKGVSCNPFHKWLFQNPTTMIIGSILERIPAKTYL